MSRQPYKFLDYYTYEDQDLFFGREKETEVFLSDIVTSRLVILFAPTGSGKTSLINAGVRPELEKLDYATLYVRVEQDPAELARRVLEETQWIPPALQRTSMVDLLVAVAEAQEKLIVVFFDQFEEFFIYINEKQPEQARQFITDVASLYRNKESGVYFVFSMREEFFIEMDAFRDEIPSIFHKDSNLRLQWFDADQARRAIVGPLKVFDTQIEEELVNVLLTLEDRTKHPSEGVAYWKV
jgi:hypothetical protein